MSKRTRSDSEKAMDIWAAKDAYQVSTALGVLAVVLLLGGLMVVTSFVGKWLGY